MRCACISVDLDSLPHYCRIHGLPEGILDTRARRLVYDTAVPRLIELLERLSLPATFFAIGEDLSDPGAAASLAAAHRAGVEIGNHSFHHDYALTRRPLADVEREVELAEGAIREATGAAPRGFRAPGYTLSAGLYQTLCERRYLYDSSTFPSAPYYAAKALVRGGLSLLGRPSRSILDTPRVLLAPRGPYRPDRRAPYRRGKGSVVELPIATSPITRLPFIGTFAVALPRAPVRVAYRSMRRMSFFNFELHGVDVLDAEDGIPEALVRQQRDLRVPKVLKLARLREVFSWLKEDYQVVTLAEAARRVREE